MATLISKIRYSVIPLYGMGCKKIAKDRATFSEMLAIIIIVVKRFMKKKTDTNLIFKC